MLSSHKTDEFRIVHDLLIRCSVLPTDDATPKAEDRQRSLGEYFRIKFRSSQTRSMNKPLESTIEAQPVVFGVPLQTSMLYANVALSLINDEGQSYIYGYIPIVVASTGAFLKKGKCEPSFMKETPTR
jgi:hypothetical protein